MEQLQQKGTVWNRIGTFHLTEGTNRNMKNNVLEHLASNLEQTGTGKGAVLQRRISGEQLEQRGTVWNRIGTFHLTEGTNRNMKNNVLEHLASDLEQTGIGKGAVLWRRISEEKF